MNKRQSAKTFYKVPGLELSLNISSVRWKTLECDSLYSLFSLLSVPNTPSTV